MRAKVTISDRFLRARDELDAAAQRALARAGGEIAAHARSKPPVNAYDISTILAKTRALPVARTVRGWVVVVTTPDFRMRFFEKGTYAKKGAAKTKRTQEKRRAEGVANAGVRPGRYLRKSLREVFPRVVDILRQELR